MARPMPELPPLMTTCPLVSLDSGEDFVFFRNIKSANEGRDVTITNGATISWINSDGTARIPPRTRLMVVMAVGVED